MAAFAQFSVYGYPSANQLISGSNDGECDTTTSTTIAVPTTSVQSPLPGSLSPNAVPTSADPLSPSSMSQTSNTGGGNGSGSGATPSSGQHLQQQQQQQQQSCQPSGQCCENGRPIMTDPVSGQTVCSCQYDSARLALSASYSRGVYGSAYPSNEQNPYPSIGMDSSAFYSPLSNPYGLKDSGSTSDMTAWTSAGLQPTSSYYPYDHSLAAYGYGAGYDLAARRKNATRESTATLKAWLNEHKKNPYPTKGEKIMLAIITKMTLTQVSTWFANARRRLKKENKMTWEPKNKTEDDDDGMVSDDDKDKDDDIDKHSAKDSNTIKDELQKDEDDDDNDYSSDRKTSQHPAYQHHPQHHHLYHNYGPYSGIRDEILNGPKNQISSDCGVPIPASKPKIWSLADTAACKTPPPHYLQNQHHQAWMENYPHQTEFMDGPQHQQQQQHHQQDHQEMMNNFQGFRDELNTQIHHMDNIHLSPTTTPINMNPHSLSTQDYHQQMVGFPEIQTDTPPQTPPNMKLPSVAANLISDTHPMTDTFNRLQNYSNTTSPSSSEDDLFFSQGNYVSPV